MNEIVVSVCMITYNHEKFIGEAIESVIKQKTNFKYEIVVAEDCSTDNTRDILLKYKEAYPDLIKLKLQKKNVGPKNNFISSIKESIGEYIAFLEGDDYWTNENKLQLQHDFLSTNKDFAVHCHRAMSFENNSGVFKLMPKQGKTISTFEDLLEFNFILTLTIMFVRRDLNEYLNFFHTKGSDYSIHLSNARFGKIYYSDLTMAVYRMHSGGIWSSKNHKERTINYINDLLLLKSELSEEFHVHLDKNITYMNAYLCKIELINGSKVTFKNILGIIKFLVLRISKMKY